MPMTCVTCNYFIGQITLDYEEKKDTICSNPKLSADEKAEEMSKLIRSYGFKECCNARIMTYKDIVYDILPVSREHDYN